MLRTLPVDASTIEKNNPEDARRGDQGRLTSRDSDAERLAKSAAAARDGKRFVLMIKAIQTDSFGELFLLAAEDWATDGLENEIKKEEIAKARAEEKAKFLANPAEQMAIAKKELEREIRDSSERIRREILDRTPREQDRDQYRTWEKDLWDRTA